MVIPVCARAGDEGIAQHRRAARRRAPAQRLVAAPGDDEVLLGDRDEPGLPGHQHVGVGGHLDAGGDVLAEGLGHRDDVVLHLAEGGALGQGGGEGVRRRAVGRRVAHDEAVGGQRLQPAGRRRAVPAAGQARPGWSPGRGPPRGRCSRALQHGAPGRRVGDPQVGQGRVAGVLLQLVEAVLHLGDGGVGDLEVDAVGLGGQVVGRLLHELLEHGRHGDGDRFASHVAAPAMGTCSPETTCHPSQAIPATMAVLTTIIRLRTPAPVRDARG